MELIYWCLDLNTRSNRWLQLKREINLHTLFHTTFRCKACLGNHPPKPLALLWLDNCPIVKCFIHRFIKRDRWHRWQRTLLLSQDTWKIHGQMYKWEIKRGYESDGWEMYHCIIAARHCFSYALMLIWQMEASSIIQ